MDFGSGVRKEEKIAKGFRRWDVKAWLWAGYSLKSAIAMMTSRGSRRRRRRRKKRILREFDIIANGFGFGVGVGVGGAFRVREVGLDKECCWARDGMERCAREGEGTMRLKRIQTYQQPFTIRKQ